MIPLLLICGWGCSEEAAQAPITRVLQIEGMHCASCETGIEASVGVINGIRICEASYEDGLARIVADDPMAIEEAIDRIRGMQFIVLTPRVK